MFKIRKEFPVMFSHFLNKHFILCIKHNIYIYNISYFNINNFCFNNTLLFTS